MLRATMMLLLPLFLAAPSAFAAEPGYVPTDAERARWTMSDMRSWAIALTAYHVDYDTYPVTTRLDEARGAIQPAYIRVAPMNDAWGTPFRIVATKSGFRLVSAGADRKFDESSWGTAAAELPSWEDDAVISESGMMLVRSWKYE